MATPQQIREWLNDPKSGPQVYGRDWDQLCQALMWQVCNRFGTALTVYGSAIEAYRASIIHGTDRHTAPAGAFHYWALGRYGHVALSLGGERCLMASSLVSERWATNVGVTTVTEYNSRVTGETYLGWSRTNGRNTVPIETTTPAGAEGITVLMSWDTTFEHPETKRQTPARDFLRYIPAYFTEVKAAIGGVLNAVRAVKPWDEPFEHPETKKPVPARDFLRLLPVYFSEVKAAIAANRVASAELTAAMERLGPPTEIRVELDADVLDAALKRALLDPTVTGTFANEIIARLRQLNFGVK